MKRFIWAWLVVCLNAVSAAAQAPNDASIRGYVRDAQGALVPGVTVTVTSPTVPQPTTVVSDQEGYVRLIGLRPATYILTAELQGFSPYVRNNIVVSSGQNLAVEVVLQVASLSESVLVTAEKREEHLSEVPIPVGVINTEKLTSTGQMLLRDYITAVPGVSIQEDIVNQQELSIRGVTQGGSGIPVVGVTVDDVPFGGATNYTAGNWIPDFDPGDLARIEVLRGPQGTLYGANSMGGLVKFVTRDPTMDRVSGEVSVGPSAVYNGAEPGYNVRGSVNIPLSRTFAIRASGYKRQDPGYVDNPVLDIKGVNEAQAGGARLSGLWLPSPKVSVKFSALYQDIKADGNSDVVSAPGLGPWQQNYIAGVGGAYERTAQAYSAVVKAKLGKIDLTSVTGYNRLRTYTTLDFGYAFTPAVEKLWGVTGAPYIQTDIPKRATQEVRFSGTIRKIDWLAGGFASHEQDPTHNAVYASNATTGQVVGLYYPFGTPSPRIYNEEAGFAAVTLHFTDRFDAQVGGRESHTSLRLDAHTESGPALGPDPVFNPESTTSANIFTYLFTPRFRVSPDLMVYGRLASGFRPGGPSYGPPGAPKDIKPDKTQNYEVGVKGDFAAHKLSLDASFFYINWQDLQLTLIDKATSFQYGSNGAGAKSEGVELSLGVRPRPGLTVEGWIVYDDAVLTQAFPATSTSSGLPGDRMPIDPRLSGHIGVTEDFPLWSGTAGFVGGDVAYVGDRVGSFTSADQPRAQFPAYTKVDLRGGVKLNPTLTANVYVNNVANERALVGGGVGYDPPIGFVYITPRTVGLNITKSF
jgi:iron complex outermembrane receptor protein